MVIKSVLPPSYQGVRPCYKLKDIADTVIYVTSRPRRVQITDIDHYGQSTGNGFIVHEK